MSKIKDVAKRAGVSAGTVDRIIHNRGRFSEETADRVRKAISDLNYKTDIRARNFSLSLKCRIAVLMPFPELNNDYWKLPLEGMKNALEELSASHVTAEFFHFHEYNHDKFQNMIRNIRKKQFDAFVIAPLLHDEILKLFDTLFDDKPVVFFDSDIESSPRYTYIGQKSVEAGHLAAKLMNQMISGSDNKILIITTDSGNEHLTDRVTGFLEKISFKTETIEIPVNPDNMTEILEKIRPKLGSEYNGVYVAYSSCHYIAQMIEEQGLEKKIPLVGYDLVPDNIMHLERETISYILTQRPIDQGYLSIKTLYKKIILGQESASEQLMPIDIITQENLASYIRMREIS
ncbi:MAG: substrate-binding domain-containing protein [Spirochaetes bacterium]|nr:substrate-binding domain-containing protein [Spirochaetota bacterium]